ncbi:D-serine ammonia-lyase [Chromobacterium haemolyticum]|uniref:D-serine ammonia-lyase n=1 Tax=Chromobacterium haemolyticum TaxID=394935 RepID=UPI00131791DF|nr:D-serine ammonia-lyase [Chromobacterium haemolyticum]BBH11007.1 putative D-serine dehydratase [Chromobacterium haemolyticum]
MQATIAGKTVADWQASHPLLTPLMALQPLSWFNPARAPAAEALADVGLSRAEVEDADARLRRFAPYLARVFPDVAASGGIIESPLLPLPAMRAALWAEAGLEASGSLWLKADNLLPISGSIKARGGIYEVLKHAEDLALSHGLLRTSDDYAGLDSAEARAFFGDYRVAVGSTGNLGLSIGIISAKLGFQASVHMSADARQWKKNLLRSHGVEVVEYPSDYSVAVAEGRKQAASDPRCHFVDDENSKNLFLGYAVAAERLRGQLAEQGVRVDAEHPLLVYLPCGVGGGPGGVAFGLKLAFGDAVHCLFAEPTHAPCMLLGVYTGLHDAVAVQDFGIDNLTAADGLAVGRPSGFVGRAMQRLIDGYYTVDDGELYRLLALLEREQGLKLEPSALAGMPGPLRVLGESQGYRQRMGLSAERLARAAHLVWGTGGGMVPPAEMDTYLAEGRRRLPA